MYIALILSDNKVYILATNNYDVLGFTSLNKAISYFEDSYNSSHGRGYEASMSACLNYITFQPSIIEVENFEDIKNNIAAQEPKKVQLSHVSGFMKAISTKDEAIEFWNKGKKPQLIRR